MKITINENNGAGETEVVINCRRADDQVMRICAGLRIFDGKITGTREDRVFILSADEIFYADTVDRKTFLYTAGDVYETPLRLYELEERLAADDFIRASKSCVLNFGKVKSLRGDFGGRLLCTLGNGEVISVSRQYAAVIKKKLGIRK